MHPTASTASLVCVLILVILWFTAFGLINGLDKELKRNPAFDSFKPGSNVTVGVQMGLDSGEGGVLVGIATTSITLRVIADRRKKAGASGQPVIGKC